MKKASAILLMIFYLIPAFGFSVTTHFCAGELTDISFYSNADSKCICGNEKIDSNCCKSKTTVVKIKDAQSKDAIVSIDFTKKQNKQFTALPNNLNSFLNTTSNFYNITYWHPPDNNPNTPIYLRIRVFRI